MVLGIAGSRKRNSSEDKEILKARIIELKPSLIVTGGIRYAGPEVFAREIAEELNIPLKEYLPFPTYFPPSEERRNADRMVEIEARDLRRALVGMHADHLLLMIHPEGKHGELITAYWFMRYRRNAAHRHKKLEIL